MRPQSQETVTGFMIKWRSVAESRNGWEQDFGVRIVETLNLFLASSETLRKLSNLSVGMGDRSFSTRI